MGPYSCPSEGFLSLACFPQVQRILVLGASSSYQHQIEYWYDCFIPARGKTSGVVLVINLARPFALVQHSSWVLFKHLASSFTGEFRGLW